MDRKRREAYLNGEKANRESYTGKSRKPLVHYWSEGQIFEVYRLKDGDYLIKDPSGKEEDREQHGTRQLIDTMNYLSEKYAKKKYILFQMIQKPLES